MPKSGTPRLAIFGAGPIGLEAALYARQAATSFHRLRTRPCWRVPAPLGSMSASSRPSG